MSSKETDSYRVLGKDYNESMIEIVQKIIQIGSSEGVVLPKKDLTRLGAKRGDMLKLKIELTNGENKHEELLREYDSFLSKYGQTLKNLTDK